MSLRTPSDFYEALLGEEAITPEEASHLLTLDETLRLEFKSGAFFKTAAAGLEMRIQASSLANAVGGQVVFGVTDERPRTIQPLEVKGRATIEQCIGDALAPLSPYLTPPYRARRVAVGHTEILLVAIARAPAFVPVVAEGRISYFIRMEDGARRAPDYLISDLILGTRRHPVLRLSVQQSVVSSQLDEQQAVHYKASFRVENESLLTAERVMVGVVGWSDQNVTGCKPATSAMKQYVTVEERDRQHSAIYVITNPGHAGVELPTIRALDSQVVLLSGAFRAPLLDGKETRTRCAVFVMADGHTPEWYQCDFRIWRDFNNIAHADVEHFERAVTNPPMVALSEHPRRPWHP